MTHKAPLRPTSFFHSHRSPYRGRSSAFFGEFFFRASSRIRDRFLRTALFPFFFPPLANALAFNPLESHPRKSGGGPPAAFPIVRSSLPSAFPSTGHFRLTLPTVTVRVTSHLFVAAQSVGLFPSCTFLSVCLFCTSARARISDAGFHLTIANGMMCSFFLTSRTVEVVTRLLDGG